MNIEFERAVYLFPLPYAQRWIAASESVGTLSELVGTGFPATSRLVERMAASGLVSRRRDDADGRIATAGLQ